MAFAEDMADFFDDDEFARAGTYTPLGGTAFAISVIIDEGVRPFADDRLNTHINSTRTEATFPAAGIAEPKKGDIITLGATVYTVVHALEFDGQMHKAIVK